MPGVFHGTKQFGRLSCVAYCMTVRSSQRISEHEFIDIYRQVQGEPWMRALKKKSAESLLKEVEAKAWLLRAVGRAEHRGLPERLFEFPHLMFQEYLAAR